MKYELKNETIRINDKILYRIRALIDFGDIKAGELGGFVESTENLSHNGNSWVSDNALVSGDACVFGDAWVSGDINR